MERIITYSPAYTLVPTYECFNRCTYCNFRVDPGQDEWLALESAKETLTALQSQNVIEILILSGEVHPHHARRPAWFQRIYDLCKLALEMGFLPHTNAGPLSMEEMRQLREVNVSMGLMVEQMTPALAQTVHTNAPSKQPAVRLQQLNQAGELNIPFTTGLLLGLGESEADWQDSLTVIARSHAQYGHIQEVILQPHQPGHRQAQTRPPCHGETLANAITLAKDILPKDITLQIPPNLIRSDDALIKCLQLGANDLGGIGPVDEANPDYTHRPHVDMVAYLLTHHYSLHARLPVYPKYDSWLPQKLKIAVQQWRQKLQQNAVKTPT